MGFFEKKSADHALKDLVEGLSTALGPKLFSVLLYGSKASGEYREGHSNVNVFILLADASLETLEQLRPSIAAWTKAGHAMPVFMPKSELALYAHNLPIEFLDMADHHTVLFGDDPLKGLAISKTNLRAQCALELSVKLLKLRQSLLLAEHKPERLRTVLAASLPGVLTLYRAVLRLESDASGGTKIAAAKEVARRAGVNADILERLWEFHTRRQTDNVEDLARDMVAGLERVLAYLHQK